MAVAYGQRFFLITPDQAGSAQELADLWDRWHLNGMRANCEHFAAPKYEHGVTASCGYSSGTAWLYEPIPAEVVARIRVLCGQHDHAAESL